MGRSAARTIIHVDMDAFYASVELLRHPELIGKPVVVGGEGGRGVIAAASYEARRFGVRSAMNSTRARQLCPAAVFLSPDHAHYAAVSAQLHEIFHRFTPLVEPLALDEAFLDVSGARTVLGDGASIAAAVREVISTELHLPCSVGVAPSKFLAKLASEAAKPVAEPFRVRPGRGVVVVAEGEELAFLHPLPVRALWGVGPVTQQRLDRLGVHTIGDLAELGEDVLVRALGEAHGRHLFELANGIDQRPVVPERRPKSIGHEETFAHDLHTTAELHDQLVRLADLVATRLRRHEVGARTVTLKVRFAGFKTVTRSASSSTPLATGPDIVRMLEPALAAVDPGPGVRLLGVSGSNLVEPAEQLSLDLLNGAGEGRAPRWEQASAALDQIRERFGQRAISPASTLPNRGRQAGTTR